MLTMSSYIKLQSFANELSVLNREIKKLGKKINQVDISKFELLNSFNVRNELTILRKDASNLIELIEKIASGGISKYTSFRERDTYSYGRHAQLKGAANDLIYDLHTLMKHIDFLFSSAAEGKKTVALVAVLSEIPDLDGDAKQADAMVGCILIIASIIATLRRLL
jgi:hypothetical protein